MAVAKNGERFKVECKIEGVWYGDDYVFPTRDAALAFRRREESHGSGNSYRIVITSAPINLPPAKGEENEDGSPDNGDPSSFDWATFFDLVVLCPATVCCADDEDMDHVLRQCDTGASLKGTVFM